MAQPNPLPDSPILPPSETEDIPQRPNLQLVEVLIHCILHQCLELQHSLFNLELRFRVRRIPCLGVDVCYRAAFGSGTVGEAEYGWVERREFCGENGGATVEDFVDGVDDVVDQGLEAQLATQFLSSSPLIHWWSSKVEKMWVQCRCCSSILALRLRTHSV